MPGLRTAFQRLPTAIKLLILLTAAVLPLGLVLVAAATTGIRQANDAMEARAADQSRLALRAIDSLIARNVLALRVASNGAMDGTGDPCARAQRSLSLVPEVPADFVLRDPLGTELCARGRPDSSERPTLLVPPGQVRLWISPEKQRLYFRVGILRGSVTGAIDRDVMVTALAATRTNVRSFVLADGNGELRIETPSGNGAQLGPDPQILTFERSIAARQLETRITVFTERVASIDRLIILLPVAMWIVASLLSWLAVRTFLLSPLRRMQAAITSHDPSQGALQLPDRLGSAVEIRELGQAFSRAVERIEHSEHEMAIALEGQRKLVREVHHRVKNNLQVVASLLNIHRRTAVTEDAKDAYSAIGRRVDALAVVHRNHYAELEENRGIALRPLLSELASNLRGSAPRDARLVEISVELESLHTTQDVAVAAAFFTTEIVEHAMLVTPDAPIKLSLRRIGDLTARFSLETGALTPEAAEQGDHAQFERIIAGLAKQLRSVLDKAPGRYSVDLPVFPPL